MLQSLKSSLGLDPVDVTFDLGNDLVSLTHLPFSFRQTVYVNDKYVAQKTTFGLSNTHKFVVRDQPYRLVCKLCGPLWCNLKVELYTDKVRIEQQKRSVLNGEPMGVLEASNMVVRWILAGMAVGTVIGTILNLALIYWGR